MGPSGASRDRFVTFVLRSGGSMPLEAVIGAAHAIRANYLCAPLLDIQQRTVTCPAPETWGTLRPAAEAAAQSVVGSTGEPAWVALVASREVDDEAAVLRGERWIDVAGRLVSPRVIERTDVLFMAHLLEDRVFARALAAVLEPIAEYDRVEKTKVLRTLDAAFLNVQGHRQVASALGIERHSVGRHLNLAAQLLGRDIRWGVDRLMIEQALLARRAMKLRPPKETEELKVLHLAEDP